jgi:hypothetical protein
MNNTKISEKDLELEYLRFFYNHIDLGENADDKKEFINSQFKSTGFIVPEQYDIYN